MAMTPQTMSNTTGRQRFIETLRFGKPDRLYLDPGYPRESTLAAWHQQGLPTDAEPFAYLMETLGLPCLGDRRQAMGVSFRMVPTFEEKVLAHRDGHYIVQDWMGAVTEISDQYDYTYIRNARDFVTRKWHSFPVQTRRDWEEKIKWRYDADDPARFPADFVEQVEAWHARSFPLTLSFNGPFWQLREWCGFEGLCLLMIEQPDFVSEMAAFWTDFVLHLLRRILAHITPDYVEISEDMAYKAHSMISPSMIRRYVFPAWQQWAAELRADGCGLIGVDSDGCIEQLLPLWIEAGINCTQPVEVAAHNDIVAYRRKHGEKMAYFQGVDKRCLAAGGEALRAEVLRVVPPLLEMGGYIPGCDHGVPPDVAWPDFVEFTRLLAQLGGWDV
jgi:hypothetical protein